MILKTFSGMFFLLLLTLMGAGLIAASVDARNANAYLANAVAEIEASNCASSVVDAWQDDAKQYEYELVVTQITPAGTSEKRHATATLTYLYRVPLVGFEREHTLRAAIR